MVLVYKHRVNSLDELSRVPLDMGVEFDLRSEGRSVVVTHDPFTTGPTVEEYLSKVGPRPCIFNIKCEGIEDHVVRCAAHYGVSDFFLLDCSIPAAIKLWRKGEQRIAVRWSEHEPIEGVMAWRGKAKYCWVDCFSRFPGGQQDWEVVSKAFDLCLVSPELQSHGLEEAARLRSQIPVGYYASVCTKRPELWGRSVE